MSTPPRKSYVSPTLVVYGNIQQITMSTGNMSGRADGATMGNDKTG